ncbi:DUF2948 family protein [Tianweitania sediminis]|uniref:DUF2948 family protein n=2 Tax=Tianweitania sediminis TaxID=1502156 RepID=A0A8J7R0X3_9HYPH|nr:DUF2948 family protein [Tianweitania sediminis]
MTMLRLAALDEEDLKIVSAHAQDAAIQVKAIRWDKQAGRVLIEMNRFVWEKRPRWLFRQRYERRRSVLHFDGVTAVRATGLSPIKQDEVLVLLSITFEPGQAPGGFITLTFAGNAALRLEVDFVEARLTDLGAAWETRNRPRHIG